jgi:glycosyltransferase involved in cell wall biosynthesis
MRSVSVVIPVYNGAPWIRHALRSVFAQTYRDFEVIVVDDGSTDDLSEALRPWADKITLARQPNAGPAKARNAGIALATGRLIAFLDADDEWLPDKLALQVAYFERYPDTGLLHTDMLGRDTPPDVQGVDSEPPHLSFCPIFHTDLLIRTLTVMIPKAVLLEVGGFDERRELHVEDWDLWLRIAARRPIGYLARPLALHRQGGHMSTKIDRTFTGQALVIEKNRALCQAACATHRSAPDRCLRARQHLLHQSWGIERFRRGNRGEAREAFARALTLQPWRPATYALYAACYLPDRWRDRVRTWRRRLGLAAPEAEA